MFTEDFESLYTPRLNILWYTYPCAGMSKHGELLPTVCCTVPQRGLINRDRTLWEGEPHLHLPCATEKFEKLAQLPRDLTKDLLKLNFSIFVAREKALANQLGRLCHPQCNKAAEDSAFRNKGNSKLLLEAFLIRSYTDFDWILSLLILPNII